ncbi:putative S-adenosylmethionine-dependent methyltransferase [Natrialba magadii ATCC 43099]|uniref:S-adenosylmethionine-dependent methyltransferase n=1 Tax=Natrialba magadii (strain ATCC 43099 / DSM 3394 / CCM 3739 / CIP 104546 / IAM 13178 / JCM 8861 / NBRC 102185 / NCIMB 2190 / MS3) TaxID=547559 RepID=D3STW0_NATMM|nr:class I SAM-dependent methyltransferase [Natrialba magadii]ADD05127.1 putative S-adenosylmethionine-dependent methyltransferase [Natrialba magadii ATCC 43099]ELY23165.1 type 11 methyltransferase [Natrialba magadii ATCC 43099]
MTASPFETHTDAYDEWFDANDGAYRAEQEALESVCPAPVPGRALEIGVGTGRFAAPLGVSRGLDPATAPLERARERGVTPVRGVAESLPFDDGALEYVQFVTVLSFVDDTATTLAEAHRVLEQDGTLVAAVLDRASPVGQVYQEHKDESPFYADADFVTADEACNLLEEAGFEVEARVQTIFEDPTELEPADVDVREGHGDGLFAVVRATPL